MHPKITILGAGFGGMITALGFAARNIPITIIEGRSVEDEDFCKDIRTTALTAASKEFFQSIDIWDHLSEFTGPFKDIYVADNKGAEMVHLSSKDLPEGQLMGHLIANTDFKRILLDLTRKNKLITLTDDTSYEVIENSDSGCELILNQKTSHQCDLLIVCDGRNSLTKQKYFSSLTNKNYDQYAMTFIVHHEKPHEGTAVEHFMPSGPFAILPLRDQNFSSIVWSIAAEKKDAILNLPDDEFLYLVQQNFGEFLGKISINSEVGVFPLKLYETRKYYNKRVVLVADSAHVMHPLAGQGLNQGIKDIETLTRLVAEQGAGEYVLQQYQNERKKDNSDMLELTDIINSVFSNHSKLFHAVRQFGFKMIEEIPILKKSLIKYAMGRR
jgi:2-octaprenyl-6-methoxyphenol hydroxylase